MFHLIFYTLSDFFTYMDVTTKNVCTFPSSSNGHQTHSDSISNKVEIFDNDIGTMEQLKRMSTDANHKNFSPMITPTSTNNKLRVAVPDGTVVDIKVLIKQLRDPDCTVKIFNSGKVVIFRCKSEMECKRASRQIGRMIQRGMNKLDQRVCIRKYRVSNIFATCRLPFSVRIEEVARKYRGEGAKYEPELTSGLEWVLEDPKSYLRIHTTGSITISGATSELDLIKSVERVYPYLKEFSYQRDRGAEVNLDDETQFMANSYNLLRKRHRQQTKAFRGSSSEKNHGILSSKKGRYVDRIEKGEKVLGTGIYNNQMYFEDEDENAIAEDEYFPEDEDCLYDEDD
uniref:TATA box-binding protein-like 1 n=1 Tax=Meloidogyne hapla TaxID=6305 RepID=A0A1I8BR44_MELHA